SQHLFVKKYFSRSSRLPHYLIQDFEDRFLLLSPGDPTILSAASLLSVQYRSCSFIFKSQRYNNIKYKDGRNSEPFQTDGSDNSKHNQNISSQIILQSHLFYFHTHQ